MDHSHLFDYLTILITTGVIIMSFLIVGLLFFIRAVNNVLGYIKTISDETTILRINFDNFIRKKEIKEKK